MECQYLSMNSTGLSSIASLPAIAKLERLELCDNALSGSMDALAQMYPNLRVLKLTNNKLAGLEDVRGLKALGKLESLDLSDNPLCGALGPDDYQKVLRGQLGPTLEVLDCINREGEEIDSDGEASEPDDDDDDDDGEEAEDEDEEDEEDDEEKAEAGQDKAKVEVEDAANEETADKPLDT